VGLGPPLGGSPGNRPQRRYRRGELVRFLAHPGPSTNSGSVARTRTGAKHCARREQPGSSATPSSKTTLPTRSTLSTCEHVLMLATASCRAAGSPAQGAGAPAATQRESELEGGTRPEVLHHVLSVRRDALQDGAYDAFRSVLRANLRSRLRSTTCWKEDQP
jgi:hypothetical protein